MRLTAKPIINWCNVNMYSFGNQWTVRSGDQLTLYFQILDADQAIQGNNQGIGIFSGVTPLGTTAGLRYLLGVGSQNQPYSIQVTFLSLDINQMLTLTAVQADITDSSIWSVTVPATAAVAGGNVLFTLYEGNSIRRFSVTNMLAVEFPLSEGMC